MHFVEAKGILSGSNGMNIYRGCSHGCIYCDLCDGSREYFYRALDKHFPGLKDWYIRTYGNAYELPSPRQEALMELLTETCVRNGILYRPADCFQYLRTLPETDTQLSLF